MYKIYFEGNVKMKIKKENINEIELKSLIQTNLQNKELEDKQDIIILLKLDDNNIALTGNKNNNEVTIFHISTQPIIVDK